jgi:16S rRNA (adenine1518-N6/adenine1519-N6)-dimethyltransferase
MNIKMLCDSSNKRDILSSVHSLLRRYHFSPTKKLGQNFLIDEHTYKVIRGAAALKAGDNVLEVGPGLGFLTEELLEDIQPNGQLVAIEKDRRFEPHLLERFGSRVRFVFQDARYLDVSQLFKPMEHFKFVGNLPYNAGTYILRNLLEDPDRPKESTVLLQKEVVDRITATPGEMSALSVAVQTIGEPIMVAIVPKDCFYPEPAVTSAVLRVCSFDTPLISGTERETFFRVIRAGFSARRKILRNAIANGFKIDVTLASAILEKAEIEQRVRPESLHVKQWITLYETIKNSYHELLST